MNIPKILEKAADLIGDGRWTKGAAYARDKDDKEIRPNYSDACKWCATGSLEKINPSREWAPFINDYGYKLGIDSLIDLQRFNDEQKEARPVVS